MAGLTRRDGMHKNYQHNSFRTYEFNNILSTFFADEYVYRYVDKQSYFKNCYKWMLLLRVPKQGGQQ